METSTTHQTVEPLNFSELLAKLREAYAASESNDDDKLTAWYLLVDEYAPVFLEELDGLATLKKDLNATKDALERAASIILASDTDKRHLNERLFAETHRNENQKIHHEVKVNELNARIEELEKANQQWKDKWDEQIKIAQDAVKRVKLKHENEALRIMTELKRRGFHDLVANIAQFV